MRIFVIVYLLFNFRLTAIYPPWLYWSHQDKEETIVDKLKNKVLGINFSKFFRRFATLVLVLLLLGGVGAGIFFRTQISEGVAFVQQRAAHSEWLSAGSEAHHPEKGDFGWHLPITKPSFGAKVYLAGFGGLCCLMFGVYWLTSSLWLYQEAIFSHMHGSLWLLGGLCVNLLAVGAFLLLRGFARKECPACGTWLSAKAKFCAHCGEKLYTQCPACGKEWDAWEHFCPACGQALQETEELIEF